MATRREHGSGTGSDDFCRNVRRLSTDIEQISIGLSEQMRSVNDNINNLTPEQITEALAQFMKDTNALEELKQITERKISELKDLRLKLLEHAKNSNDNMRQVQGRAGTRDSGYASTDSQLVNRSACETSSLVTQPSDAHPELASVSSMSGPHALATNMSRVSLRESEHEERSEAEC
ncbi:uncharacterized protein LOC128222548 [Mya arenaria]|uniref:uncharacterized protein LOC128222548 n=1 Tax=Mya arenaria TaxID=6604 RepID=UPI0022E1147D|nr:uncharacterized protein LOC128222548 [Mya arenaria]XP_052787570.1 uncharacterized protein LOC128222548 [Mya arenaria]